VIKVTGVGGGTGGTRGACTGSITQLMACLHMFPTCMVRQSCEQV